jgi:Flp pilus assembly protein TadG
MLKNVFTRAFVRRFATIVRDRRGVVLQETAIIMPLLVTMILGGYEIARFAILQQKLSRTVMTTSDMVTQGGTISKPEIDLIFAATSTMIQPFAGGPSQLVIVSSVSAVGAAAPKLVWQRTGGGTLTGVTSKIGTVVGGNVTLPPGFLVRPDTDVIIAEIFYNFTPTFIPALVPPHVVYHRAIFSPRQGSLTALCDDPC